MARQRKRPVPKVGQLLWVREPDGSKVRQVEVTYVGIYHFHTTPEFRSHPDDVWHLEDWEPVDDPIPYRLTMTKGNPNAGKHTSSESKAQGKLRYPLAKKQRSTLHYAIVDDALRLVEFPQAKLREWALEGAIRAGLIPERITEGITNEDISG